MSRDIDTLLDGLKEQLKRLGLEKKAANDLICVVQSHGDPSSLYNGESSK